MNARLALAALVFVSLAGTRLPAQGITQPIHWQFALSANPDFRGSPDHLVLVRLATVAEQWDGKPIAGAPITHALMEYNCTRTKSRRLGADFQERDSSAVVRILADSVATQDWTTPKPGSPGALQMQASCKAVPGR